MSAVIAPAVASEILAAVDASDGTDRALDRIANEHGLFLNEVKDLAARRHGRAHLSQPSPRPTPPATPAAMPVHRLPVSELAERIDTGKASTRKRTRALAERIEADLKKLAGYVAEEQRAEKEAKAKAAAKAKARADVDRLERELRDARKLLGQEGLTAAEIRTWARENHIECPATGRVPKNVRAAYDARSEAS